MIFRNEYAFLSNFAPCTVNFEGLAYPNVECAFQAAKTLDVNARIPFTKCKANEAKKLGRKIQLRDDWEFIKLDIMDRLLEEKFPSNPAHANYNYSRKLMDLGENLNIVEENTWHDNFWGSCICPKCNGKGKNMLGKALMKRRFRLLYPNTHI